MMLLGKKNVFFLSLVVIALFGVDTCLASGGIDEFATSADKVMKTITGPFGRYVSIIMMAVCGIVLWWQKDDLSGGIKLLLQVVFAISFIAFASGIVDKLFTFTGAVI